MFTPSVLGAINDQIKHELASAYVYLSMASYLESQNLAGCAHWMRVQSNEELGHAMKFFDFAINRGGRVVLQAIEQPPSDFESVLDVFEQALEHERHITARIHQLFELSVRENDYPTQVMLHWFIEEQVEEEKNASEIVELIRMSGGQGTALIMLDRQLAARAN